MTLPHLLIVMILAVVHMSNARHSTPPRKGRTSATCPPCPSKFRSSSTESPKIVAYYPQWGIYERDYFVKDIMDSESAQKLDYIMYAFGGVSSSGECIAVDPNADYEKQFLSHESGDGEADTPDQTLFGNFNQLRKLKTI